MRIAIFSLLAVYGAMAGLPDVRSEPNPERRAKLALENADAALTAARDAYAKRDNSLTAASLKELEDSVELARQSLEETGKDPRRRPKAFKYGESHTRELMRRMASLENAMDFDDRKLLEAAKNKLREVNEAWLLGIMTGHKRSDQ